MSFPSQSIPTSDFKSHDEKKRREKSLNWTFIVSIPPGFRFGLKFLATHHPDELKPTIDH